MKHIAADGYDEALDAALAAADGERVEQGLGRMLMLAVTSVDDGTGYFLGKKLSRAGRGMAHHENVGVHRVERHRGIEHGLALGDRRGRNGHIEHVGAKS